MRGFFILIVTEISSKFLLPHSKSFLMLPNKTLKSLKWKQLSFPCWVDATRWPQMENKDFVCEICLCMSLILTPSLFSLFCLPRRPTAPSWLSWWFCSTSEWLFCLSTFLFKGADAFRVNLRMLEKKRKKKETKSWVLQQICCPSVSRAEEGSGAGRAEGWAEGLGRVQSGWSPKNRSREVPGCRRLR